METKIFYRVANINSEQGLWYSIDGNFTGDIIQNIISVLTLDCLCLMMKTL